MPEITDSTPGSFARTVQGRTGPDDRLKRGVELAAELVEGCDCAGVSLVSRLGVQTPASSGDVALRGDALQYELREGPCLDTVRQEHTVISADLADEVRWPRWAPRVRSELGVNAMMSLLLYTEADTLGALNLYAKQPNAWTDHSLVVALALADQLAVALADAREIDQRGLAMASRTIIGQAQGIVMERLGIDAERAFAYLRRISQDTNRKLVAVAEDLVTTRRLPGGESGETGAIDGGVDGRR